MPKYRKKILSKTHLFWTKHEVVKMFIPHKTKISGFYKETASENKELFFGITQKKILPTIDNIYYSVFIENDGQERTVAQLLPLLEELLAKKAIVQETREPQPFTNGLVVTLKSVKRQYNICLSEMDIYDIFMNGSERLPNKDTNRIHTQLRAFGLWTRGIEDVLEESFLKIEALLADYGLKISHVQENRIDYCYHTNIKSDVNKIFNERNEQYFETTLEGGFDHFKTTKHKGKTMLHRNYFMFGKKDGNWLARFYDKVKEVIESGYKSFFFKMWHDNGLISFYDRYCMEYALPYKNMDYIEKAKLAFYVEFGGNAERRKEYEKDLNNPSKSLDYYRKKASEFMPETNPVINIEFQTMREFYKYSDDFINNLKHSERDCHPKLNRIYKILDNRGFFLKWLNSEGLYFADGKDENGNPSYLDWWDRIRKVKVGGIKADEKLLREYEHKIDKKVVARQTIGKIASISVYENRLNTDFLDDYTNLIHTLTDNEAHKMDEILIKNSNGDIVKELKSSLLNDYDVLKAKKEMRLKNRKKAQTPGSTPNDIEKPGYKENRLITCLICSATKPASQFWTYGGDGEENVGQCKECLRLVTLERGENNE
jgi:hypothetical protein